MEGAGNSVFLRGVLAGAPVFSHMGGGERFDVFPLEVERLSGRIDRLNVIVRHRLLETAEVSDGDKLAVTGELRSYNNHSGVGSRLVITALARMLEVCYGPDENRVQLRGTLCKEPLPRVTPLGRRICDLMLAVNRPYGRSDYLPVIAWGASARLAGGFHTGDRIALTGRFQSREYTKLTDGAGLRRTAYEISAVTLEREDRSE